MTFNRFIYLIFVLLLFSSAAAQNTRRLSKSQKHEIDSLTVSTLQKLSYEHNRFQIFDSQLKNHIILGTDFELAMDSIMQIERRSLEIKTDHNEKLRNILTVEQRAAFDVQFATDKEYITPSVPIMEINRSSFPDYHSRKNIIMSNVLSLPLKNINITYQRKFTERFGGNISITMMPKTQTPFVEQINNYLAGYNPEEDAPREFNNPLVNMKTTGFIASLELRYFFPYQKYMANSSLSGFYIGGYYSHSDYTYTTNFEGSFLGINFGVDAEARFKSDGLGITFGNQWIVKDRFVIDFTFLRLGIHNNSTKGYVTVDHDNINLIEYFEEVLDFEMNIWQNLEKNVTSTRELDFKNQKAATGFMTAIRLGYLF